jgi:hypothetical protein
MKPQGCEKTQHHKKVTFEQHCTWWRAEGKHQERVYLTVVGADWKAECRATAVISALGYQYQLEHSGLVGQEHVQ